MHICTQHPRLRLVDPGALTHMVSPSATGGLCLWHKRCRWFVSTWSWSSCAMSLHHVDNNLERDLAATRSSVNVITVCDILDPPRIECSGGPSPIQLAGVWAMQIVVIRCCMCPHEDQCQLQHQMQCCLHWR